MIITESQLKALLPTNQRYQVWLGPVNEILPAWQIDTPLRVAAFFGQTTHESSDWTVLIENLNYSQAGLRATWPSRFKTDATAALYARQPAKIASYVYADRLGNGPEPSGDGWIYRGRGLIMNTGKASYAAASNDLYKDTRFVDYPDLVAQPDYAMECACWFWNKNNLNRLADQGDCRTISIRVNGGTIGLAERIKRYTRALAILGS